MSSKRNRGARTANGRSDMVLPTPERGQHNEIELAEKTIKDEQGNISRPYMAIDILGAMGSPAASGRGFQGSLR